MPSVRVQASHEDSSAATDNAHRYTNSNQRKGAVVNRFEHEFSHGMCHKAKLVRAEYACVEHVLNMRDCVQVLNMWDVCKAASWEKIPRSFVIPRMVMFEDVPASEYVEDLDDELDGWYADYFSSDEYEENLSYNALMREIAREKAMKLAFPQTLWILKPASGLQGKGIKVFSSATGTIDGIELMLATHVEANEDIRDRAGRDPYSLWIIQKYLLPTTIAPQLKEGRARHKFDLRLYALVVSDSRGKGAEVFLYKEGLVRVALQAFACSQDSITNNRVHTTNTAKLKGIAGGAKGEPGLKAHHFVLPMEDLQAQLIGNGLPWQVRGGGRSLTAL